MQKNGKLSNGIPELDLWDSIDRFTGGAYVPSVNDQHWKNLDQRIQYSDYTAFEFCYYVVHYDSDRGDSHNVATVQKRNLMCSEAVWKKFLRYKENLPNRLPISLHLQRETLYVAFNNRDALEVLLSPSYEVGPVLRVEMSLQRQCSNEFNAEPVLKRWGELAGEHLMGIPEQLPFMPRIKKDLEVNGDVSRFLFPKPN